MLRVLKIFIVLIVVSFSGIVMSQNETNNWYFGNNGGLSFSEGNLAVLNNGNMNTPAGCSSISDRNGDLLFYTNGQTIWNKNHEIMENGSNLSGDPNNTQSSIIVPKPNDENTYYIFGTREASSTQPLVGSGLYLTEIQFSNANPLGKVVIKSSRLLSHSTERITAIHHNNGQSIWVIAFGKETSQDDLPKDTFFMFDVTENGVNRSAIISKQQPTLSSVGAMKISPNGKTIAVADFDQGQVFLYDFNETTGAVIFKFQVLVDLLFTPISPYGIEFSQDSEILYVSGKNAPQTSYLMKWELNNNAWDAGKVIVTTSTEYDFGSLQLATNGKIYMAKYFKNDPITSSDYIAVINKPEDKIDNRYISNAVNLESGNSFKGLPNFIQSYFRNRIIAQNDCVSDSLYFSLDAYAPIESVLWEFGDGTTSTEKDVYHQYNNSGKYIVKATMTLNGQPVEVFKEVIVYPLPELQSGQTLLQCDTDNDGMASFNLYNIEEKMDNPGNIQYEFSFFTSNTDALNNINSIANPELYINESNPQEIFVEIISPEGCKTLSSFFIETTYTSLDGIETMVTCEISDDIYNNNQGVFNLRSKEIEIRNQFNIPETSNILFYQSFQDAETKTNAISGYYTTATSTLWVRIDNKDFGCFGIEPIELIVNSTVEMNIADRYTICDPNLQATIILDGGKSNETWEWKDENGTILSTNSEFEVTKPGSYIFSTSKNENNIVCSTTKKFTVNQTGSPIFQKVKGEDYQIFVSVSGESDYEYSLDNINFYGNGLNHNFTSVSAGVYTVYVRDINNCEPTINTKVSIIGFPKYFTPNDDGYNDVWQVEGVTEDLYNYADIVIFDRYGKYLYRMDLIKNQEGWNGYFNGEKLPPTDYWFKVRLIDKDNNTFEKIGHFSLKQ